MTRILNKKVAKTIAVIVLAVSFIVAGAPTIASAAIARDNHINSNDAGPDLCAGASCSFNYTVNSSSNTILFVTTVVGGSGAGNVTSVTYNGVAMTEQANSPQTTDAGVNRLQQFYLVAPAQGTNTVAVTRASGGGAFVVNAASYSGAKQTGQPDSTLTATAVGNVTGNFTTVADNSWVYVACRNDVSNPMTAGTNATAVAGQGVATFDNNTFGSITPAGSFSLTCNAGSGSSRLLGLSFSPAAAPTDNGAILQLGMTF